ncbi:MAG: endonuclease/exonuclease/phosphatase family protein [Actinomycetota bacterium]|nr:endonuclease/exonuclease/phosphatase family protein [Actinomycetota bacterium]
MIRVVAYNMSGGLDANAVSAVLAAVEPDIVCAVEVPPRFGLRRLARRVGLEVAATAGRRRLSVAILTAERVRVVSAVAHQLSPVPGIVPRSVAQAILGVKALRLTAFAVQFGLRPDVRATHCRDLEEHLRKVSTPVVVGADLNEAPNGAVAQRLASTLQDAYAVSGQGIGDTYPNPEPLARKDYVFVDRALTVLRSWVPEDPPVAVASQHRPVVAEVAEAAKGRATSRSRRGAAAARSSLSRPGAAAQAPTAPAEPAA